MAWQADSGVTCQVLPRVMFRKFCCCGKLKLNGNPLVKEAESDCPHVCLSEECEPEGIL